MRTPLLAAVAAAASFVAVALASPDAGAVVRVITVHGLHGKSGDQNGLVDRINAWNSGYVFVKVKYYGNGDRTDYGTSSMADSAAHNINWHGPCGYCGGSSSSSCYLADAKKECPWGWDVFAGRCHGHGGTNSSSGTYFAYDHNDWADIRHLGMHLAWFLNDHYGSSYYTNIVAHSMGGLVTRSMFRMAGKTNYPPASSSTAMVSNVVSFGTPHQGVFGVPIGPTEIVEIGDDSGFINDLQTYGGWSTDFSRVGSALNDSSWPQGKDEAQFNNSVRSRVAIIYDDWQKAYDHQYVYGYGSNTTIGGGSWTYLGSYQPSYTHSGYFSNSDNFYHGGTGYSGDYIQQHNGGGYSWRLNNAPQSIRLAYYAIYYGASY